MSKRKFRQVSQQKGQRYPTLDRFDRQDRRSFLVRLGATVLGAGTLAAGLSACGDSRAVETEPDMGHPPGGPPMPDARADTMQEPDGQVMMGVARAPDAEIDKPDAGVKKNDMMMAPGYAPVMDARIDDGGE